MRFFFGFTAVLLRFIFAFLPYLLPIILWIGVRQLAGSLVGNSYFYGAAVTVAPLLVFLVVVIGVFASVVPIGGYYYLSSAGTLVSGILGFYYEYQRWEPFFGSPGYTTGFILSNLNWPLVGAAFICVLSFIASIVAVTPKFQKWRMQKENKDAHGSASWMPLKKAREKLSEGSLVLGEAYDPRKNPKKGGSAPLLKFDGRGHLLTIAGSGSGKTVSVAIPNVLSWEHNLVVNDPKGELAEKCASARRARGRKVVQLDPNNPRTDTVNVLDWLDPSKPSVIENATAVISWLDNDGEEKQDDYFKAEGKKLLLSLLLHILFAPEIGDELRTLRSLREVVTSGEVEEYLRDICERDPDYGFGVPQQYAREMLAIADTAEKQWAGIIGYASQMTSWLSQPALCSLVSGSLEKGPAFTTYETLSSDLDVFISIPLKTLESTPGPAKTIIGALLGIRYEYSYGGNKQKFPRTLFLLDEMPVLGNMKALETALKVGRGAGVVLWAIIQDIGQLDKHWGTHGRDGWFANSQVKTFFGIGDLGTAKIVSESLGKSTIVTSTANDSMQKGDAMGLGAGGSASVGMAYQSIARELLTPEELMAMTQDQNGTPDEQIILVRNSQPIRCGMAKYYRRHEMVINNEY